MAEVLTLEATPTDAHNSVVSSPLVSVVVVGQIPPPMNGQSLMIREFLAGEYSGLRLEHVPMVFSRSTAEIGTPGIRKLGLLFRTLAHIIHTRFKTKATVLYYPPAGANLVPVLRDLFLLIPSRLIFRHTVFHFHAAGLYEIYPRLPAPLRPLFRLAYGKPDLAIFTTMSTSAEAALLHARSTAIIPCGVHDAAPGSVRRKAASEDSPIILFAGILSEGKGLLTLLDACAILLARNIKFRLMCLGAFQPLAFRNQVDALIRAAGLQDSVSFPGVLTGNDKADAFASASVFCFPSHYPAESFGVVLIEAMSYSLPIVATQWQGIPEVAGSGGGTLLVPIKQPTPLADSLEALLLSPDRRKSMGVLNRERYLERFTIAIYRENLHKALRALSFAPTRSS
jgi:glycosyltransferase involved in cell wall biosynthesis